MLQAIVLDPVIVKGKGRLKGLLVGPCATAPVGSCRMYKGPFLGGNWIELSLKDRYLRKGYYVGVANRSGCQSDSCCHGDACARDTQEQGTV